MKYLKQIKPLLLGLLLLPSLLQAQSSPQAPSGPLTLEQCISYALSNRPDVKQAQLDETIGERQIRASLSAWLPQLSARYTVLHNIKLQTAAFGDNVVTLGTRYNSNILLQADQTLYSNEVAVATRAARFTREQLDLNTLDTKINTVVAVSKAFYDVLLTQEQLRILEENIVRQEKQYRDARSRFESGLVDKTDYQRASITLANTRSDRKRTQESIKAKLALLKQLMGLSPETALDISFDQNLMQQQTLPDTTLQPDFANRVELQQLRTQQQLLKLNTSYYRWGFLPTVSAYINYNPIYLSNSFSDLYSVARPASAVGLQAAIPIFQGTKRLQNIRIAELEEEQLVLDMENTRSVINTEYQTALANYKSNYTDWLTLRENAEVAEEVYNIIKLQYDEGIKAYVDLIVAETDLKATQLNYYNALYRLLASKLDYQRAIGTINVN
ncbi:TolC family protein [Botryobacter ruber]|uniref:TolC family protein n=1 Tax=Botryobacter ruber TaxID=2171629 RepID=UPI000E0A6779|nr:TolC family protein [Botryobacter ruber]